MPYISINSHVACKTAEKLRAARGRKLRFDGISVDQYLEIEKPKLSCLQFLNLSHSIHITLIMWCTIHVRWTLVKHVYLHSLKSTARLRCHPRCDYWNSRTGSHCGLTILYQMSVQWPYSLEIREKESELRTACKGKDLTVADRDYPAVGRTKWLIGYRSLDIPWFVNQNTTASLQSN